MTQENHRAERSIAFLPQRLDSIVREPGNCFGSRCGGFALVALVIAVFGMSLPRLDAAEATTSENTTTESGESLQALLIEASEARDDGRLEDQKQLLEQARGKGDVTQNYLILLELANCSRALDRLRDARRYASEAVQLIPEEPAGYLTLAIMEKNSGQLDSALQTLARARERSRNALMTLQLDLVTAGYLYHAKQTADAAELFARVLPIVETDDNYTSNLAWFYAVSGDKEKFYEKFERALAINPRQALDWAEAEADLDRYRGEERFKALVERVTDSLESGW